MASHKYGFCIHVSHSDSKVFYLTNVPPDAWRCSAWFELTKSFRFHRATPEWSRSKLCCGKQSQSVLVACWWALNIRLTKSLEPFRPYLQPDGEEAAICSNLSSTKGNSRPPKSTSLQLHVQEYVCGNFSDTRNGREDKYDHVTSQTCVFPVVKACPLSASAKTYRGRSMTPKYQRKGHLCPDLVFTPFHN